MQNKKSGGRKQSESEMKLEEFLTEDGFDEEDEDSVTDDTLEFLCLDDDMIESYQSSRSVSGKSGSRDEDYEDEDDEDYEDEDDEDDEDYEDEDYDDEEYDDERGGVFARIWSHLADMSTLDMVVAMFGVFVIAGVIVTSALVVHAKTIEKQVEAFAAVGEEIEGISVIGESGLLAVSESARLSDMLDMEEEEEQQEVEEEEKDGIEVTLNLTSIQSDLKVKFVNKSTGKLISGVSFEVEVTGGSQSYEWQDDDRDGIIYKTEIPAGTYSVKAKPLAGQDAEKYQLPAGAVSVKVSDKITYKKVDVADEIKDESQINVAAEEKEGGDIAVESQLTDTVEWVESTKTPIDSEENFSEIKKEDIADPGKSSRSISGFARLVSDNNVDECNCTVHCTAPNPACPVCKDRPGDCKIAAPVGPTDKEKIAGLSISGDLNLKVGAQGTLSLVGSYSSEASVASWSSDNSAVSVPNGASGTSVTITAQAAGTAKVTASVTIGGESALVSCTVTVQNAEPTDQQKANSFSLNKTSLGLVQGASETLLVSSSGNYAASSVTWSSGDQKIATVDGSGKVTAVAAGTTKITAVVKVGDASSQTPLECTVSVTAKSCKITKIEGDAKIKVGDTGTIKYTPEPADSKIEWKSENDKIAKVESADGTAVKIKGVAEGKVKIVAQCGGAKIENGEWTVEVVKNLAADNKTKLKDKKGNQVYIKKDGKYVEATYADYYTADKFYLSKAMYRYTGWQTIDGSVYFFDKDGNYVTGEQVIQGAKYNFGSDGRLSKGSGSMGIDVSKHNGSIDWNAVKNSGVSYAIIRCGYRGYSTGVLVEDPKFASNIKGAKAAGIKVGVYIYSQAVNEVEAVEEASMALNLVRGYGLEYPIFIDVEASGGRADGIGSGMRTAVCQAFCQTVQNSGYSAGVYSNKNWLTEQINTGSLTGYKIWLAQYAAAPTYSATRHDMWQYSSKGQVSGISGNVDMNISYLNY